MKWGGFMALTLSLHRGDKEKPGHTLVVFIHGLGAPETTWINGDKTWKDLILTDNNLQNVDVAIAKYDTAHVALGLLNELGIKNIKIGWFRNITVGKGPFTDIKILSQELKRELNTNRSKEYEKVIIVGHSMGGLIGIRYILEEIEHNENINVKGFISLATPYNGSNKAFYNSLIKSIHKHAQIPALEPNSVFLDDTIRLWQKHKDNTNIKFTFCFGTNDEWVAQESSIPHIVSSKWRDSIPLPGDHSSILNVDNHESPSYVVVSESIQKILLEENELKKKRNEILNEQEDLSIARCITRWQATGLPKDKAKIIYEQLEYKFNFMEPTCDKPISLLIGEFGIGKSLIADLMFQNFIKESKKNEKLPIPIYLKASKDIVNLRDYIEEIAIKNGDDINKGISLIIDGMDEVETSIASRLLDEARVIVQVWKNSRIVLMSRPLPIFSKLEESIIIPLLSQEEAYHIISLVSEKEITIGFSSSWPQVVKEAVNRPLFALLFGLYLIDEDMRVPRSKGDLLTHLVERSLSRLEISNERSKLLLKKFAVIATDRGNVPISKSEFVTEDEFKHLVKSGLVIEVNGMASFTLPILSQWFAAQAILENMKDIRDLISDQKVMENWRYPLIIFISLFSNDLVKDKFSIIAENNPAFASIIVEEGLASWGLSDEIAPPPFMESGKRIRSAMDAWVKGIGPLARLIAPIDKEGQVLPIGVRVTKGSIISSWYYGKNKINDITEIENHLSPLDRFDNGWLNVKMARPGKHSSWAWRWTRDDLRNELSKILQERRLPITKGPIFLEEVWKTSLVLTNRGSLYSGNILVEEISELLNHKFRNIDNIIIGSKPCNLRYVREYINLIKESGTEFLNNPWPGPDLDYSIGGWVWGPYSNQRLYERTRIVYLQAMEAYEQIVDEFFPGLKNRLTKSVIFPAKLRGKLVIPKKTDSFNNCPIFNWFLEPLPAKCQSEIDIAVSDQSDDNLDIHNKLTDLYNKLRICRPQAAEWISANYCNQVLDIFQANPVREIVYGWIWDDLKRIYWVHGLLGHRID
jgi:predicted esterase